MFEEFFIFISEISFKRNRIHITLFFGIITDSTTSKILLTNVSKKVERIPEEPRPVLWSRDTDKKSAGFLTVVLSPQKMNNFTFHNKLSKLKVFCKTLYCSILFKR